VETRQREARSRGDEICETIAEKSSGVTVSRVVGLGLDIFCDCESAFESEVDGENCSFLDAVAMFPITTV